MSDVTFTPAEPSTLGVRTIDDLATGTPAAYSRQPAQSTPAQPDPVPAPFEQLPVDPQTGAPYRPWTVGGVTVRCAAQLPVGALAEIASLQARLPRPGEQESDEMRTRPIELLAASWKSVVWDDDIPTVEARLRDKIRPVSPDELRDALNGLYLQYGGGTGKGQ